MFESRLDPWHTFFLESLGCVNLSRISTGGIYRRPARPPHSAAPHVMNRDWFPRLHRIRAFLTLIPTTATVPKFGLVRNQISSLHYFPGGQLCNSWERIITETIVGPNFYVLLSYAMYIFSSRSSGRLHGQPRSATHAQARNNWLWGARYFLYPTPWAVTHWCAVSCKWQKKLCMGSW